MGLMSQVGDDVTLSKCVVHMMKHDRGAVAGIQSHVNREHEPRTNRDIDATKTDLNYHLVEPPASYHKAIKQRVDSLNLKRAVRKDAVLMCSFIVSSDKGYFDGLSQEQQRAFFADAVKFFQGRYGQENVIAATVHMDEGTPHMHLCLTPIRDGKLSAKAIFTKNELRDLQTQFAASVGVLHGLERGEENSKAEHLSELDYKLKARTQSLEATEKRIAALEATEIQRKKAAAQYEELSQGLETIECEPTLFSKKTVIVDKADLDRFAYAAKSAIARTNDEIMTRIEVEKKLTKTEKELDNVTRERDSLRKEQTALRSFRQKFLLVPEEIRKTAEKKHLEISQELEKVRSLPKYLQTKHGETAELIRAIGFDDERYWLFKSEKSGEEFAVRVGLKIGNHIDCGKENKKFKIGEIVKIAHYGDRFFAQISHLSPREIEIRQKRLEMFEKREHELERKNEHSRGFGR